MLMLKVPYILTCAYLQQAINHLQNLCRVPWGQIGNRFSFEGYTEKKKRAKMTLLAELFGRL